MNKLTKLIKLGAHKTHSTIDDDRFSVTSFTDYSNDSSMTEDFFTNDNFRRIIKCLDHGSDVLSDLLDWITNYHDLLQETAKSKRSLTKTWKTKLKEQSAISSYNTTKLVQLIAIESSLNEAKLIESRCEILSQIAEELQRGIDRLYINPGIGRSKKHRRSDEFERSFKTARFDVKRLTDSIKQIERQKRKAEEDLKDAEIRCENLKFSSQTKQDKIQHAEITQRQKQIHLETINAELKSTKEQIEKEQLIYREKALLIFRDCQICEKERLDFIRKILLKFITSIYPDEYSNKMVELYQKVCSSIEETQSSNEDLKYWADAYNVNNSVNLCNQESSIETNKDSDSSDDNLGVPI